MFFALVRIAITLGAALFGYVQARRFVQTRLRFVDAVHGLKAPLVAGGAALLLASCVVWLLPWFGAGTAILFGLGVAGGVSAGAREVRRRIGPGIV